MRKRKTPLKKQKEIKEREARAWFEYNKPHQSYRSVAKTMGISHTQAMDYVNSFKKSL